MLFFELITALSCLLAVAVASPVPTPMRGRSSSGFNLLDWFKSKFSCCARSESAVSGELAGIFNRPERPIGNSINMQISDRNIHIGGGGHPLSIEDLDASSQLHIMKIDVHSVSTPDIHQTPQFRLPTESHFTFGDVHDDSPPASRVVVNSHPDHKVLAAKAKVNSERHRGTDGHGRPKVGLGVIEETAREAMSESNTLYKSFPPSNIVDSNSKLEDASESILPAPDRKHQASVQ